MENVIDPILEEGNKKKDKLWNLNFFLLWQGQLVSKFGDSIYTIAVSYWILLITGSTALMGTLAAAAVLPRIFISPFAGTFIDRNNRKAILIIADLLSGTMATIVGITALMGIENQWIFFVAAVVIGVCNCFFDPAVNSIIPDIIPKSRLVNANAALSSIHTANGTMGNMIAGSLIQVLGAPLLFLVNGISYIFSAITEFFIEVPNNQNEKTNVSFWNDMKLGIKYIKSFSGLKHLYFVIALLNFCASMSIMLLIPFFKEGANLGMGKYGIAMATQSAGLFVSFALLSIFQIDDKKKFTFFYLSGFISGVTMILFTLTNNFYLMLVLLFVCGASVAVTNSLIQVAMQASVSSEMRSKVYAFRRTLSSSLMPIAMLIGGILAEFISINLIIRFNYIAILILFIYISKVKCVKEMMND